MSRNTLCCPQCGLAIGPHETACSACGADVRLWVRRGARIWGPYDLAKVREGVATGRVVADDEVAVGHGDWVRIGAVDLSGRQVELTQKTVSSAETWRLCLRVLLAGIIVAASIGGMTYARWAGSRDDVRCRENLRLIGLAWRAYSLDYGERLPVSPLWPEQLARYLLPDDEHWTCPKTGRPYEIANLYNALIGDTGALVWDAATPKAPHRGRWYVLRVDGSVVESSAPLELGTSVETPSARKR